MSYSLLLLLHIGIAASSIPLLTILAWQVYQKTVKPWFINVVFASNLLTVLTGIILMFAGADFTRACITMSVYTLACFALIYAARKQVNPVLEVI